MKRICVSNNRRFFMYSDGTPFFYLADTAWELLHRLDREEAELYFANRQRKRFTVIQAVVLAEFDGLNASNVYGERPLIANDPTRPNEAYFAYVDELIQMAAAHELVVGLLPTWGDKVTPMWGAGPQVFDVENARVYGRFLGGRYRDQANIIWILGGDRPAVRENADWRPIWRAMAAGIDEGTGGAATMTYHPNGGASTSAWLHDEAWLDFNMMQSGHGGGRDVPVWDKIGHDYALHPAKPTLDGEPNYEDHPVSPWPKWDPANGYFRDHDVRKQLYRSVFAGGCGVTYGHHSIWQFAGERYGSINHADRDWLAALDRPGASQVQHLRALIESRPFFSRIPDQSILVSDEGQGMKHVQATRDQDGSYALVYLPLPLPVTVNLGVLSSERIDAWWYDPCIGEAALIGQFEANGTPTFTPPGYRPDWVLVLDDAGKHYAVPGRPA
ncbi:MAG: glycoside hydrolase family 140 protein [Anaerolineae bacterium]|nr:glycoside hydrolase family 140 protein [Anaerolineae bacterium]